MDFFEDSGDFRDSFLIFGGFFRFLLFFLAVFLYWVSLFDLFWNKITRSLKVVA